jgi:hypothetical protein
VTARLEDRIDMSSPAVQWRHVPRHFHDFISGLRPSPGTRAKALAAAAGAARCLNGMFRSQPSAEDGYRVIGGFAKGTAILPAKAIDMLYVLPPERRPREGAGTDDPSPLLDAMKRRLSQRYGAVQIAREGWLAIAPEGGGPAVRLIPCFACPQGGFLMANGLGGGMWRQSNPKAEAQDLRQADLISAGKATHLILMLKAWRRENSVPIPALELELLVSEFAGLWTYQRRSLLFYDWMVRDFYFWLISQGGRRLPIPGSVETVALDHAWLTSAEAAYAHARRACRLERDNGDAAAPWRLIFGPAFADGPPSAAPPLPSPSPPPPPRLSPPQ